MLQVQYIKEHKETVLKGLDKRNFKDAETVVDRVITLDENRRATQTSLEATLAEANKLSKEIGSLFKTGQVEKANELKQQTGDLKQKSKELSITISSLIQILMCIRKPYTIPKSGLKTLYSM